MGRDLLLQFITNGFVEKVLIPSTGCISLDKMMALHQSFRDPVWACHSLVYAIVGSPWTALLWIQMPALHSLCQVSISLFLSFFFLLSFSLYRLWDRVG